MSGHVNLDNSVRLPKVTYSSLIPSFPTQRLLYQCKKDDQAQVYKHKLIIISHCTVFFKVSALYVYSIIKYCTVHTIGIKLIHKVLLRHIIIYCNIIFSLNITDCIVVDPSSPCGVHTQTEANYPCFHTMGEQSRQEVPSTYYTNTNTGAEKLYSHTTKPALLDSS